MLVASYLGCNTLSHGGLNSMTTWHQRLKLRMRERKVTQEKLATALNISQGSVGHYVSGRRNPRKEVMEKIADELEVSLDWLAGKTDTPPIDNREFYAVPIVTAKNAINLKHYQEESSSMGYAPISVEWITKKEIVAQNLCICLIEDDAMSPKLNIGDKILIDTGEKELINSKVFAFIVNDKLFIRRAVQRLDNTWTISSDNKSSLYQDEIINNNDINNTIQLIGRVVLSISDF